MCSRGRPRNSWFGDIKQWSGRNGYEATQSAGDRHLWSIISHRPLLRRWYPQVKKLVVLVVLPGPMSFRLMLVADERGLPAELYSTWIQSAPGSELEFKTSPGTLGYLPWVGAVSVCWNMSVQCASSAWGLPLAFTSRPPARQEQRFRHPMHRLVYTQHCQTRYSRDGGMPAGSTC